MARIARPVRAELVARFEDYRWSSATAHLRGRDDLLVRTQPLLEMVSDWRTFLQSALSDEELTDLRRHEHTGRPLGDERFIEGIERKIDRLLRRQKPGPKPKIEGR